MYRVMIVLCLAVSGCSTTPPPPVLQFPDPPAPLMQPPEKLKPLPKVKEGDQAPVDPQTVTETVVDNYATCHDTEGRLIDLQEWVRKQKAEADKLLKMDL